MEAPKGVPAAPVRTCGWPSLLGSEEQGCDPAATIDDRGVDFEVRVVARDGDAFHWISLFHPSESEWKSLDPKKPVLVRARGGDAPPVASPPFWPTEPPCECPPETVRACLGN
jgi:hypothetical protein